jgi:uncharacterized membrane protein
MAENPVPTGDITDNDKLMAALSYPIPFIAIIILLVAEMKNRPFQKYHAVQAIAADILLGIVVSIVGAIFSALGLCGLPSLLWLLTFYWAYLAYQGQYFEIPWLTQFLKSQKWL